MRKRLLCTVCLLFLIVQSILLVFKSGNALFEVPASSVFFDKDGKTISVQGQVYQKSNTSNYQILYLTNNSVHDSKLLVYDKKFTNISVGQTVHLKGRTSRFERARNPGNFDRALYYARQDIYGAIWCEEVIQITGESNFVMNTLYQIKFKWKQNLIRIMGEKNGNVLSAMLIGEKSDMDENIKELYQKNGISHVLAISGLHISFIGLGVYRIIRKLGANYAIAGIVAAIILSVYVLLLGFSVSIMRAYVMLLLRIGADMCGRVYDMPTALSLAAAFTVWKQPLYLTDGGFWMSYGAIAGILYVLPMLQNLFRVRKKWLKNVMDAALVSIAVNIALFPILLWFFYEFSPYSTIFNIVIIPLMSVLLGLGMAGSFFLVWIEPMGILCLKVCTLILEFFEMVTTLGSRLPFASIVLGKPKMWEIIVYYIVLLFMVVYAKRYRKKYIYFLFLCSLITMIWQPKGGLQITMLDVGQGDGIFMRSPTGQTYFIDGGSSDVEELGRYRIEPYLKSQGVQTLDYVFVTHGDVDHYSGIAEMLKRRLFGIWIKRLVLSQNFKQDEELMDLATLATKCGTDVLVIKAGETILDGNTSITCIQPDVHDKRLEGNASSLILEINSGAFSMLCTGDVEGEGETELTNRIKNKSYDVLKVSHHGSKNSTTEEFLKNINADIALISAGKGNRYGHPHKETIQRLKAKGCHIYQTKKSGAITLFVKLNSLTISSLPYRL